jgi:hypothetical protein
VVNRWSTSPSWWVGIRVTEAKSPLRRRRLSRCRPCRSLHRAQPLGHQLSQLSMVFKHARDYRGTLRTGHLLTRNGS